MGVVCLKWLGMCTIPLCTALVAENLVSMNIIKIINRTGQDYEVFTRCSVPPHILPETSSADLIEWTRQMYLLAGDTGFLDISIKTQNYFGCQVKLAPISKMSKLPTYYLRGGIRTSGACPSWRYDGPFAFDVVVRERDLFEQTPHRFLRRIRYCGVGRSASAVTIEPDGLSLKGEGRLTVLGSDKNNVDKVSLSDFAGVEHE